MSAYVMFALSDDRDAARNAVCPAIDHFASGDIDARLAKLGIVEHVGADQRVDRYAAAGTTRDCAAALNELYAAGADSLILVPALGDSYEAQLAQVRLAASELAPLVG